MCTGLLFTKHVTKKVPLSGNRRFNVGGGGGGGDISKNSMGLHSVAHPVLILSHERGNTISRGEPHGEEQLYFHSD